MNVVNLAEKLAQFDTRWDPKVAGSYNGNDIMVVKVEGTPNSGDSATAARKETT